MVTEIVISLILLFVGIIVLVIVHICVIGRAFEREFEEDGGGMDEISSSRNEIPAMPDEDLKKLDCFDYEAGEKGDGAVDCVVCLENFNVGDKCRLLPNCNHSFHVKCIDSWLLKTPICPICRTCASIQNICMFSGEGSSVSGDIRVGFTERIPV